MNGKTYYGIAKEKEEAAKEFEERISAGENAGLVESRYCACFSSHDTNNSQPTHCCNSCIIIQVLGKGCVLRVCYIILLAQAKMCALCMMPISSLQRYRCVLSAH